MDNRNQPQSISYNLEGKMKPGKVFIHLEWSVDLDNLAMVESAQHEIEHTLMEVPVSDLIETEVDKNIPMSFIWNNYLPLGLDSNGDIPSDGLFNSEDSSFKELIGEEEEDPYFALITGQEITWQQRIVNALNHSTSKPDNKVKTNILE